MFLLDDLLLAPIKGVVWVADKIDEMVETELTDDSRVREELLELQMRLELDEITEDEYQQGETELMGRLEEIRKYKEGT
ncbi:MAG: gas vesicle protein GvpG [Geobacter sp.]|nr:gas vesicle protein GvpG [Geobacter sp.]